MSLESNYKGEDPKASHSGWGCWSGLNLEAGEAGEAGEGRYFIRRCQSIRARPKSQYYIQRQRIRPPQIWPKSGRHSPHARPPFHPHLVPPAASPSHLVPPMTRMRGQLAERKRCMRSTTLGLNPDPGAPCHSQAAPTPATAVHPLVHPSASAVAGVSGAEESRPEKYKCGERCEQAGPTAVVQPVSPCSQRRAVQPPRGSGTSMRMTPEVRLLSSGSEATRSVTARCRAWTAAARLAYVQEGNKARLDQQETVTLGSVEGDSIPPLSEGPCPCLDMLVHRERESAFLSQAISPPWCGSPQPARLWCGRLAPSRLIPGWAV